MADETEPTKAVWTHSRSLADWSVSPKRVSETTSMAEFNRAALSGELLMTTQIALSRKISVDVHYPQVFKGLRDELAMLAKLVRRLLLELWATGIEVFQR